MTIRDKYQKDYKDVEYRNPRIVRREIYAAKSFKMAITIGIVAIIILIIYFFFFSSAFAIKKITVADTTRINKADIEKIAWDKVNDNRLFWIKNHNLFLFNDKLIIKEINKSYDYESLIVKKKLANELVITLIEKKAVLNWLSNNLCIELDDTGSAIQYCQAQNVLPKIKDVANTEAKIGQGIISKDQLANFLHLFSLLYDFKLKFSVIQLERGANQLTVQTSLNFVIYLNENIDFDNQIFKLKIFLNNEDVINKLNEIKYIDLRFDKIFYQ